MKKVFIEQASGEYKEMFRQNGFEPISDWKKADLVCFTGGADVSPALYGHPKHMTTYSNIDRDISCMYLFRSCRFLGIPMVGICRGGQFLNVANGGYMIQDCQGHCRDHDLLVRVSYDQKEEECKASSTHHQMMQPGPLGRVIGVAPPGTCNRAVEWSIKEGVWVTETGDNAPNNEIVVYQETKSLCFQPHPEFDGYEKLREIFFKLITARLGVY